MLDHLLRCFLCGAIGCLLLTACIQPPSAHTIPVPATTVEATAPVTETAAGDPLAGFDQQSWFSSSPDRVWQVEGLAALPKVSGERYYTELRVKKADGSVEWMPVAEWSCFGLGYTTPQPLRWSPDGRYLYFTNTPVADGCGLFVNASDLQRLNLVDGTVTEILPSGVTWSLAVAPDGETVAYSKDDQLYIRNLFTEDYASVRVEGPESNAQWGNFVWSPDSQQLAFTIAYAPCQPPDWRHSIVVVDTQSMTMTTVLEKDPRRLTATTWIDTSQLMLIDQQQQQWALNVHTGTVAAPSGLRTESNASLSPLPTASPTLAPTPIIMPATAEQRPTFSQDLLFVNAQGVQYWNHRTNQIDTLAAPTLDSRPPVASIIDQQAKSGLPIGAITNLSVSATGEKIAFARYTGVMNGQDQYRIDLYDRSSTKTVTLVSAITWLFDLQLSTDGTWVAYLAQDTIWAVPTDGLSQPRPIGFCRGPLFPEVNLQCVRQLIQSQDNQLAWADAEGLWVAPMDENSVQLIAPNATILPVSIKVYTPWAWSPSGQYLSTWLGHYEGSSQAIINSKTKHVVEVANSFEYINPGVRLTWLADDRVALVRPAPLYGKTKPTLEFWSLGDGSKLQLHLDRSVTIPVASDSVPIEPFQFTNGNLGFAVLNSHPESQSDRGLFLWDQQQIRRVNALPVSTDNPALSGIARLSGQLYWLADGTGALLQELDIGYLLYIPMDGTPLYDLKPLMGNYVWGISWLPNQ